MSAIVEVHNLTKEYKIRHLTGGYLSLRERLSNPFRRSSSEEDFSALEDVSFQVQRGESIGIVGRNGAGKSTLLKILSKITPPTKGKIICRGRVASLLEVGTGFHPELTGRENIFFNGSLLGMKSQEIKARFDEIVDFSGTERFLDTQLKHYSSGMQLRLAFSVAAFLEPEVLMIDEVLAVGDAEFQKKCLNKMSDVSHSGRTILFVSHNMAAVKNLCSKALLFSGGKLVEEGDVDKVLNHYRELFEKNSTDRYVQLRERREAAYFRSIEACLTGSQPYYKLQLGCEMVSSSRHKDIFLAFDIVNSIGVTIMQAIPKLEPFISYSELPQRVQVEIDLPPLIPDLYKVSVWIGSHNTETISWDEEVVGFEILETPTAGRNFPHSFNHGFIVPPSRVSHG
ncbi:MAG TPA: ABC transporter ATP-binding protein [Cyclobacteriaceae bacterium]|nr:ABC transporter ATP-binding protein [Cyclobacteriaceae bacterium]